MEKEKNFTLISRDLSFLPKPRDHWHILQKPRVGEVNGIHTMRGVAFATNGIMVAIKTEEQKIIFGHLDWFVPDREESPSKGVEEKSGKVGKQKVFSSILNDIFGQLSPNGSEDHFSSQQES